ncbi:MAG: glycosyltransferase family 4 protein [Nitrospirae bacterium]|nr:glycosyltransferase family 4 protein [Nitrospirota bacterium]
MTVLHINKFHYMRAGAETAYFRTAVLLEKAGHKSAFFSMHHHKNLNYGDIKYFLPFFLPNVELAKSNYNLLEQLRISGRILYSFKARDLLSRMLQEYKAIDIAHLHNIYHHISPSILPALRKRNIPVVMTLHDYKMVCTSYSMWANGTRCEDCAGGKYFMALKKRCVKNSISKTLLSTLEMYLHQKFLDIYDNVDIFISPSLFLRDKFREMGFRKEIVYLPNFIDIENRNDFSPVTDEEREQQERAVVYFGRLSEEKGLWTLIKAAELSSGTGNNKIIFKIIGDGPLRKRLEEAVKEKGIDNVIFLGFMNHDRMWGEIKRSRAVVIPSEWYENNPLSVIESFALGMPVIGARIGGIPELIENGRTGLLFESGDAEDLAQKLRYIIDSPARLSEMGRNARLYAERELNSQRHYDKLLQIYDLAMHKRAHNK